MFEFNASEIIPNLWQGGAPPAGPYLHEEGFGLLVLCALEYQPPGPLFDRVEVIHAPADDDFDNPPPREALTLALSTANRVVEAYRRGLKIMVTCRMGVNRSGLVTALSLHKLFGVSGSSAIQTIKKARPFALSNPQFLACLERIV